MRNPLYQISTLRKYARNIGWPAALLLRYFDLKSRVSNTERRTHELRLKNAKFPVRMRMHTSDRDVLGQVFIEGEYGSVLVSNPKMILDLGANVGYTSAYFLSKYPSSQVLAVEPDPDNYEICCRNLAPFGSRATVLRGAAWNQRTRLVLDRGTYRDGRDWSTQVRSPGENFAGVANVEAYDMSSLLSLSGVREIDLLKIDIEKSEIALFSGETSTWLPRIRNICIELHGPDCAEVFFQALSNYSYQLSQPGDLTICSDLKLLH